MPIFLDRHDLTGFSAADVAEAHRRDMEIQADYGVNFITYWFDASRNSGFCLIDDPTAGAPGKIGGSARWSLPLSSPT